MKYEITTDGGREILLLEDVVTRVEVGATCREAALAFMEGARLGWDKADLAGWLAGPYARASCRPAASAGAAGSEPPSAPAAPAAIQDLVVQVRDQVLASLENAVLAHGPVVAFPIAEDALARHLVRRVVARDGQAVYVPIDVPRMRLRDRVRSLFAADYLVMPEAYRDLFVCHRCEAILFDAAAKRAGVCRAHARASDFYGTEEPEASDGAA